MKKLGHANANANSVIQTNKGHTACVINIADDLVVVAELMFDVLNDLSIACGVEINEDEFVDKFNLECKCFVFCSFFLLFVL